MQLADANNKSEISTQPTPNSSNVNVANATEVKPDEPILPKSMTVDSIITNINDTDDIDESDMKTTIMNVYEKSGKNLVNSYIKELTESYDSLGVKYKIELFPEIDNNNIEQPKSKQMSIDEIKNIENNTNDVGFFNKMLNSVGLTTAVDANIVKKDEFSKIPDNYTGVIRVEERIKEEKEVKKGVFN